MRNLFWALAITISTCGIAQDQGYQAIEIAAEDGLIIYSDLYKTSKNEKPVVLLFHQAGSNAPAEYGKYIIPHLRKAGYDVLAIDQRKGGSRLGGENRTAAQVDEGKLTYCDAYPDLVATLKYAKQNFENGIIIWGSSYSAALVYKLATDYPKDVTAVLAFSPASGKPMGDCGRTSLLKISKYLQLLSGQETKPHMGALKARWSYLNLMGLKPMFHLTAFMVPPC